jgi:hypothetical protein
MTLMTESHDFIENVGNMFYYLFRAKNKMVGAGVMNMEKVSRKNRGRLPLPLPEKRCYRVTATISENYRTEMQKYANQWGIGCGTILRRMVKNVITNRISLIDLLKFSVRNNDESSKEKVKNKITINTRLTEKESVDFYAIASSWDFLPGVLARLLVHYFLEMPDKNSLWV